MIYIFMYQLESEAFEQTHYIGTDGIDPLWEAFANFYAAVKCEDKILSPQLFSKAIKTMGNTDEMIEFFTNVTKGAVKIVDLFEGAKRIDIGQGLSCST